MLDEATQFLRAGEVVVIPTDTIYGFAANALGREKIYLLKQRPKSNPLVLFVDSVTALEPFIKEIPPGGKELMEAHWPGPLTLVLPAKDEPTLAIRIRDHPLVLELLKKTGPLFVTSVNISGTPPLKTATEIESVFGEDFPILDGTVPEKGEPSTILSYKEGFWEIDRIGALTKCAVPIKMKKST